VLIDLQINAATTTWPVLRESARAAEAAGYDALWVFDHLAGLSVNGTSMLEAFTLLGALAASTDRLALGTLVVNVFNRQPAVTALAAASVQAIGARPMFLGLGAGGAPASPWSAEMHAVGQPVEASLPRRHARVEQTIDTCRRLWDPRRPAELATFPRPDPPPQLHVGASGVALATIAGRRADGLNVAWSHPRREELVGAARAARASLGPASDLGDLVVTTYAPWRAELLDASHAERQEMDGLGIERLILMVRHPDPAALAAATPR
jgi:alkanesulfonate monooxygenase SsuD/methylene tetrahydromethanopterin reductase-like flavin-dependent oxidoreductase (luciferase family)